jgi:hypothetical protein
VSALYKAATHEHDELLDESGHIAQRRKDAQEMLEVHCCCCCSSTSIITRLSSV